MTNLYALAEDPEDTLERGLPATPQITVEEFQALADAEAPFASMFGLDVEEIGRGTARFRMTWDTIMAGPGGSVTGAALMALADFAIYGVVLSVVGKVPLAVTTSLNVSLVRRCPRGDITCDARLVRAGNRLITAEAWIASVPGNHIVAQATGTYSVPPPDKR